MELNASAEEISRLQRCINDLVSLLALPAVWSGSEPSRILEILFDSLLPTLSLDFICGRLQDPVSNAPVEVMRVARSCDLEPHEIREMLSDWFEGDGQKRPPATRKQFGDHGIAIFPVELELRGGTGMILTGSGREDFPAQTESLVLSAAANQASIWLNEARLLTQRRRATDQLETQVAERAKELFEANEKLKRNEEALQAREGGLRSIIDAIPTLAWSAGPDGSADFLNRRWLDYTGLSEKQAQGWGWGTAIHPADVEGIVKHWQSALASGVPVEAEARMRRFDGTYRWFLFLANPLRDELGKVIKWYGTNVDIEDRKRVEEGLRASELSWRRTVDNIPGFVLVTDPMGRVEFLNRQILEYFGKTSEDLKIWDVIDVVHPDDLPRSVEARKKSIETGQMYEAELRCRRADGVYRWFQVRGIPVRDEENKITARYLLLTDIEDRKRGEEALQSNERNLNLILNTIPTHIYILNGEGFVQEVNQAVMDYTGLTLDDVQQEDYRNRVIHPEDFKRVRGARAAALRRGAPFSTEQRVLGNDGQYRWFLVRYKPLLDEQGLIVRWYVAAFDIEDRKRAEAQAEQAYLRLAEAQRLSKTGSFITDLLADEHDWSEEAFRIFDFDPTTKVTVQRIRNLIEPQDLPSFDAMIARAVKGADVDFVFRILTSRGAVKHIRGMARVMEQVAGRPLFIGALQDVTESKVAEEALNRARSELAHVARITTLNALTASIAHEINQPLASLITNASICLRRLNANPPNIDGARETAMRTIRDGNRASDVITRLRALYSKKEFTPEALDLNEATREVMALSFSDLQRNNVILRSELADGLPLITGDRIQLQQVILNLVRNASDAMTLVNDRPRDLLIRTEPEGADGVRLSVKDAGHGFPREAGDKLFQPFFTTKNDGLGIGLHVSRSIIEAHRGRLWATTNDGHGATFSFAIPCGPEGSGGIQTRSGRTDAARSNSISGQSRTKVE
jgi:PAS domain S-box-containing protein